MSCSRLPSPDCEYIDADGKCHKGNPQVGSDNAALADAESGTTLEPLTISKQDVRGVVGF
eukprot:SAG31_NODE_1714_length_7462_cov_29.616596_3_plen_60_part_00